MNDTPDMFASRDVRHFTGRECHLRSRLCLNVQYARCAFVHKNLDLARDAKHAPLLEESFLLASRAYTMLSIDMKPAPVEIAVELLTCAASTKLVETSALNVLFVLCDARNNHLY